MRICIFDTCHRKSVSRELCVSHYSQWRRNGYLKEIKRHRSNCSIENCKLKHKALGYCNKHYKRLKKQKVKAKPLKYSPRHRKFCTLCKEEKTFDRFYRNNRGKQLVTSHCKKCHQGRMAKRRYGIEPQEYLNIMDAAQNCEICNISKENVRLVFDHDHKTNKFRGILCDACNTGIGFLKDNIEILLSAIKYLER